MKTIKKLLLTILVFGGAILVLSLFVSAIWFAVIHKEGYGFSFYQVALCLLGSNGLSNPPAWPDLAIGLVSTLMLAMFSAYITFHLVWRNALILGKEITLKRSDGLITASIPLTARRTVYDVRVFLSYYDKAQTLLPSDDVQTIPMLIKGGRRGVEFPIDYTTYLLFALKDMFNSEKDCDIYVTANYTNITTSQQSVVTKKLRIADFDTKHAQGSVASGQQIRQMIKAGRFPIETRKLQVVHGEAVEISPLTMIPEGKPVKGTKIKVNFQKRKDDGIDNSFVSAYLNFNSSPQNWLHLYNDNAALVFDVKGDGNIQECMLEVKFGLRLEKLIDYKIKFGGDEVTKHCIVNLQKEYSRQFGLEALKDIREVCFVVFKNGQKGKEVVSFSIMDLCMQLS